MASPTTNTYRATLVANSINPAISGKAYGVEIGNGVYTAVFTANENNIGERTATISLGLGSTLTLVCLDRGNGGVSWYADMSAGATPTVSTIFVFEMDLEKNTVGKV